MKIPWSILAAALFLTGTASGSAQRLITLTVTATGVDKVYDGKTAAVVTLSDDRVPGDVLTVSYSSATFADKKAGTAKPVTVSGITISGPDAWKYEVNSTATTTADITRRALTVIVIGVNKVCNGTTAATVTLLDDRVAGDVFTINYASATFADKNVGTAKPVTVRGITITGPDAGNYVFNSSATTTADITARALTVIAIGVNKVYDGTTAATVTLSDDRVAGDLLVVTYASATFADKNVGSAKPVTVTGITISGPDAGCYVVNSSATTTADILPRPLNVLFIGGNKVYDGKTAAVVTPSDDRVPGDVLTVNYTSAMFGDKKVGSGKTVTVSGIRITGPDAGNYVVNSSATTAADITPRNLHMRFTGGNKVYDGTIIAPVTVSHDGVSGDLLTINYSATFADKNVGSAKRVTVRITIKGPDAGNYAYKYLSTVADITPRPLNVHFNGVNKKYDGTTTATVIPVDDRVPGDVLTVNYASALFADKNVGIAKLVTVTGITIKGPDAGNYVVNTSATTTADILLRALTVIVNAVNKVYDGRNIAPVTISDDRVPGDMLTVSYGSATFADKKAGTAKPVTVSGITISGPDAGNYVVIISATTTANILPRPLNVLFTGGNKVYDGNTAATVTLLDDRVAGDVLTVSYASALFGDKNVGSGKTVTVSGIVIRGPDAGNYVVNSNATTTADILPRVITVIPGGVNKVYDGTTAATVIFAADRVPRDLLTFNYVSATFADKNVGRGKTVIVIGITIKGPDAGNYLVNSTATTTADILPRILNVLFIGVNKVYDGTTAATVIFADDRVPGDLLTVNYGSAMFADENVGSAKPVTVSGITISGPDARNYTVNTTASTTADILILATTSSLTVTGGSVQYSDVATFQASLSPAKVLGGQSPATTVTFYVGTQKVGTANLDVIGGALQGTLMAALLEPTPFGTPPTGQMAPGSHPVTAIFNGVNPNFAVNNPPAGTLAIAPEDPRATYTGAAFAATSSAKSSTATVTLSATLQDISATSDAAGDGSAGDIRNARVTFLDRDNGTVIQANVPVGLVSASDTRIGTATCDWSVDIGTSSSRTYTVGVIVTNYYARNSSDDNAVVTVSKPPSEFITGGGYLVLTNSSGLYAGEAGTKNNFGFNVKYDKQGTGLQGNFNTVVRNRGRVYEVKGNAMTSLSVQPTTAGGTATFSGTASIHDITHPHAPIAIDGNATLLVLMADLGEPGTADSIAITVLNKNGGLWFASNWTGTETVAQVLGGGNLQVHGARGGARSGPTSARLSDPTRDAIPLMYAFPQSFPNPFSTSTSIRFELPERSRVTLTIYDVMGREVASLADRPFEPGYHVASWSGRNREGYPLGAGVYFLRMVATSLTGSGGLRAERRLVLVK